MEWGVEMCQMVHDLVIVYAQDFQEHIPHVTGAFGWLDAPVHQLHGQKDP